MKQDKATFTQKDLVNLFIFYGSSTWSKDLSTKFTLGDSLFVAVKLAKNADTNKDGYSGYGTGFDAC